ncbi:porin family protein [uncultured Flavobacterium sp.]|uniref:porin family protein n=1 Tax=uncultured Flavobacterium sp. TaxID=165435 RepID=UPI0030EC8557|tara:strand:+ start:43613 stop:44257 length:645 start_codon:yes stop_codon:yes gene_type:complete
MKKLLFAAVAVFALGNVNAQDMKFGVKAGLNVFTLTGDVEDAESLIGAHAGVFAEFKISDKFSFQPELVYSMQGAKNEESSTETFGGETYTEKYESKLKLSYINIPLMAKYYVSEKFSLEAGPQIGFLMSAKNDFTYTLTGGGFDESESANEDVKDGFKGIDFGFNFGLAYDFTENVFAGARYNLGLGDINDVDGSDAKINNAGFQVSVGYKFN